METRNNEKTKKPHRRIPSVRTPLADAPRSRISRFYRPSHEVGAGLQGAISPKHSGFTVIYSNSQTRLCRRMSHSKGPVTCKFLRCLGNPPFEVASFKISPRRTQRGLRSFPKARTFEKAGHHGRGTLVPIFAEGFPVVGSEPTTSRTSRRVP